MTEEIEKPKGKAKRKATSDRHYIDDVKFRAALIEYQQSVAQAETSGQSKPMVPDYIAQCLMLLARKYARGPKFSRYPYIEDMIGDAIMCCFKNVAKFNPEHPKAFPYFTMIVHHSFLQRIVKEKTALYRLFKAIIERQKDLCGIADVEVSQIYGSRYSDIEMRAFCVNFENYLANKRLKSKERKKEKASKIQFDLDEGGDVDGLPLDDALESLEID